MDECKIQSEIREKEWKNNINRVFHIQICQSWDTVLSFVWSSPVAGPVQTFNCCVVTVYRPSDCVPLRHGEGDSLTKADRNVANAVSLTYDGTVLAVQACHTGHDPCGLRQLGQTCTVLTSM